MQVSASIAADSASERTDIEAVPVQLQELFEAQVRLRPDRPALIFGDLSLTYRQLNDRANDLARLLRSEGIGPEKLVGIIMDRSEAPFVAILAVLKTGAGYVPIDHSNSAERVEWIARDARLDLLICDSVTHATAKAVATCPVLNIEEVADLAPISERANSAPPQRDPSGKDVCYVIYTSGSTGRPKGVVVEHRNVLAFVQAALALYGVGSEDRVYQGFSLAFDASVEETWLALASGGTLVVASAEQARDPESAPKLMRDCGITVFSTVPTFLSLIEDPLPTVRVLILGGEKCSPRLVDRRAIGRKMFNTYGPTEATVVASAWVCQSGRAVSIGTPLAGYTVAIVDESLHPVKTGEIGEILIGGKGVARGYLNQPALTSDRFIDHETLGRCYRSGDLAWIDDMGDIMFVGRADDQIKIRGFRVELGEVEAALLEQPGVRSAAVRIHDAAASQLAAYIVVDDAAAIDRDALVTRLRRRLPDYMMPAFLDRIETIPTLSSGKTNRAALPPPKTILLHSSPGGGNPPQSPMEMKMASLWSELLGGHVVGVEDDFFHDLGGHSLLAARLVTKLRTQLHLPISVRDIYRHPTIRKLAAHAETRSRNAGPPGSEDNQSGPTLAEQEFNAQPRWRRGLCYGLQFLGVVLLFGIMALPAVAEVRAIRAFLLGLMSLPGLIAWSAGVFFLTYPLLILTAVAAKWVLVGRYQPGSQRLWGAGYFRFWLASRMQALARFDLLAGSPCMVWVCRLMGARIGKRSVINTPHLGAFDLIDIGDDTSIGAETQLLAYRIEDGRLKFGRIHIGDRCFVGMHSAIGLDARMADDSRLDDLSLLPDGQTIPAGAHRQGSPAQSAEVFVPAPQHHPQSHPVSAAMMHVLAIYLYFAVLVLGMTPAGCLAVWLDPKVSSYWMLVPMAVSIAIAFVLGMVGSIVIAKRLAGRGQVGAMSVQSPAYVRLWFVERLMLFSRTFLLPLYATLYTPLFLRLLGAKIGKGCEVSTVSNIHPDQLSVGRESFLADGAVLGGTRIFHGVAEVGVNRVGSRTFIGNGAVLPMGATLGDDTLIGCVSVAPTGPQPPPDKTHWLGSPPFSLPRLQPSTQFDETMIYHPTRQMIAQRLMFDAVRILLPMTILVIQVQCFVALLLNWEGGFTSAVMAGAVCALGLELAAALCAVAVKWILLGRCQPVVKPLWSHYVWRNEIVNGVYESVFAPAGLVLLGTPILSVMLRLIGIRIGKGVYVGTTLFSEFDLVEIDDYSALNLGATIQTHLFEDRIMKSSQLRIGKGCAVGNMAVVLYDTQLGDGARLAPLSLLMKGESLRHRWTWVGIPIDACWSSEKFNDASDPSGRNATNGHTRPLTPLER
jgi:non-ribosomal peptide synthetase-like protein